MSGTASSNSRGRPIASASRRSPRRAGLGIATEVDQSPGSVEADHAGLRPNDLYDAAMARAVVVERNGVESRFGFSLVSRARLYGERKRVIVDEEGRPTIGGWLTTDGSMLLLPGARAEL